MRRLASYGWQYVCRTAKNSQLWLGDELTNFAGLAVEPASLVSVAQVAFRKYEYGPVQAMALWQAGYKGPLYLSAAIPANAKD